MGTYATRTVADGEDSIIVFPIALSEELGWGPGTDVLISKDSGVITITRVQKPAREQTEQRSYA